MKFTKDELRVIQAALITTGGNEINEFIQTKKISEKNCYLLYKSAMRKISEKLKD